MAQTPEQIQRSRQRKGLTRGLLIGAAAVGLPALANAWVQRKAGRLEPSTWGRAHSYSGPHGELTFQQLGEGPPLLLLHSFGPGFDNNEWRRASEILAAHHRVYALDLPGWGRSPRPSSRPAKQQANPHSSGRLDGAFYADVVLDFVRNVLAEPTVIVASGLSAAYALHAAAEAPRLVRALGLVCPRGLDARGTGHKGLGRSGSGRGRDFKDVLLYALLRVPILGTAALNLFTSRNQLRTYLRQEVYGAPDRVDAALVEHHYRSSHEPGSQAVLGAYLTGALQLPLKGVLEDFDLPVWLAWGRHAGSPAVHRADRWLKHLPQADLEVFEGSALLPHAEEPVAFCRKLEAFLQGQVQAASP